MNEELLLTTWKNFYKKNSNWKDLNKVTSYAEYLGISDKSHLDNIKKNPVNFLKQTTGEFFISTPKSAIALTDKLLPYLDNSVFNVHFKDIIDYLTVYYYSREYRKTIKTQVEYKMEEPSVLMVADSGK